MKLVYVGFAPLHHKNTHAGYHQIQKYLKYDYNIICQNEYEFCDKKSNNILFNLIRLIYKKTLGNQMPIAMVKFHIFK